MVKNVLLFFRNTYKTNVTRSRFDCVSFYNAGLLGLVSLEVLNHLATLNVLLREVIRVCACLHSRLETGFDCVDKVPKK